jgi:DNA-directed RNA polymerase sigma subunit (sigma70/sigma32)
MCTGCKHLGIHDFHYFYCAGQDAQNKDPANKVPYPWRGAGTQLHRGPYPDQGCPYEPAPPSTAEMVTKRIKNMVGYVESDHKDEVLKGALMAASLLTKEHAAELAKRDQYTNQLSNQLDGVRSDMQHVVSIFRKYDPQQ